MAATKNYGPTRLVVGAHYGIVDFIAQRLTAVIMAVYTLVLIVGLLVMPSFSYENWKALFTFHVYAIPLGQLLATLFFFALAWHAWIGVADFWLDYVRPNAVPMPLQVQ